MTTTMASPKRVRRGQNTPAMNVKTHARSMLLPVTLIFYTITLESCQIKPYFSLGRSLHYCKYGNHCNKGPKRANNWNVCARARLLTCNRNHGTEAESLLHRLRPFDSVLLTGTSVQCRSVLFIVKLEAG